jgi:hypothetical protein
LLHKFSRYYPMSESVQRDAQWSPFHDMWSFRYGVQRTPLHAEGLIQMSRTKTLKIAPTYFDHQIIIIREIFYPGENNWLKFESSIVVMRQYSFIRFACCIVWRGMSTCRHASSSSILALRWYSLFLKCLIASCRTWFRLYCFGLDPVTIAF